MAWFSMLLGGCGSQPTRASAADFNWAQFSGKAPRNAIDHSAWSRFLARYRVLQHETWGSRIDYAAVTPEDRRMLDRYVQALSRVSLEKYTSSQQLAYWLNLYNALTVQAVLNNNSNNRQQLDEIYQRQGLGGYQYAPLVRVSGVPLSLYDIQTHIVQPIWNDPNLNLLLACAELDCAELAPIAFTASNVYYFAESALDSHLSLPGAVTLNDNVLVISRALGSLARAESDYQQFFRRLAYRVDSNLALKLLAFDGDVLDTQVMEIRVQSSPLVVSAR